MKTNNLIKPLLMAFLISFNFSTYAQHWVLGGNSNAFPDDVALPGANFMGTNAVAAVNLIPVEIGTGGISRIHIDAAGGVNPGFVGINNTAPKYITDIIGTKVGDGVNISFPNTIANPNNNHQVGYSIGDNMFIWHSGDYTSVYCGIASEFPATPTFTLSPAAQYANTFVGYQTGMAFNTTSAIGKTTGTRNNTFVGYQAGTAIATVQNNSLYS